MFGMDLVLFCSWRAARGPETGVSRRERREGEIKFFSPLIFSPLIHSLFLKCLNRFSPRADPPQLLAPLRTPHGVDCNALHRHARFDLLARGRSDGAPHSLRLSSHERLDFGSQAAGAGRRRARLQGDAQGSQGACESMGSLRRSLSSSGSRIGRGKAGARKTMQKGRRRSCFFGDGGRCRPPSTTSNAPEKETLSLPFFVHRARSASALSRHGRRKSHLLGLCGIEQNSTLEWLFFASFFCLFSSPKKKT